MPDQELQEKSNKPRTVYAVPYTVYTIVKGTIHTKQVILSVRSPAKNKPENITSLAEVIKSFYQLIVPLLDSSKNPAHTNLHLPDSPTTDLTQSSFLL